MAASSKQQQPPDAQPSECDTSSICGGIAIFFTIGVMMSPLILLGLYMRDPPQYSAAIVAASGLLDFHQLMPGLPATLDPEFNLTIRITSRSRDEACLHPATSVQVSYLRVPLAEGHVQAAGLCAPPWKRRDVSGVKARGKAVPVPGFLLDSLAEDVRKGQAVFEVALMRPWGAEWFVITCWAKIGDTGRLDVPCVRSWMDARLPVPHAGQ